MKCGCSTLKAVFPGFSPQMSGFDQRAVYVERSTATPQLTDQLKLQHKFP